MQKPSQAQLRPNTFRPVDAATAAEHMTEVAEALERPDVADILPPTTDPAVIAAWFEGHDDAAPAICSEALRDVPPLRARGIAVRMVRHHGRIGGTL